MDRMVGMSGRMIVGLVFGVLFGGCQSYTFLFQPDTERGAAHLRFEVQTPAKADILFVIDNSSSMAQEQEALRTGVDRLLSVLGQADTSYRIGIVSTDAHGFQTNCCGEVNPPIEVGGQISVLGARGDCRRCGCDEACDQCASCEPEVTLNRPHDGVAGRLLAAFDPQVFTRESYPDLSDAEWARFAPLLPTSGEEVSPVIDREQQVARVCDACGCASCDDPGQCSADERECITRLSSELIAGLFRSNLAGLGTSGFGWEEGIKSALLATGVQPEEFTDALALNVAGSLLGEGAPNGWVNPAGAWEPWLRDDALLAVMLVSDEDDCSMPQGLMEVRHSFEEGSFPEGSMCYQAEARDSLLGVNRMSRLLLDRKGGSNALLALGFIGGVRPSGEGGLSWRSGEPADCHVATTGAADYSCSCLEGAPSEVYSQWCGFTRNTTAIGAACAALGGSRYVQFVEGFRRRSFDSICEETPERGVGAALERFARMATLACFELDGVRPAGGKAENIEVKRRDRDVPGAGYVTLTQTAEDSSEAGWYYDEDENKLCLTRIDRRLGDGYEIRILHTDTVDYAN